ncbi:MAG: 50S ribosomal protein L10 [Candidatus Omnitrophica bacterium]|nr:50S ribosomal protein L10 [Candidatus Omnitrophota bacterium]
MSEKYGKKVRELMVKEMKDIISEKKGFVLSNVENIKANEIDVFRKKMRQSGSQYIVIKNKLANIALKESGVDELASSIADKKTHGIGVIEDDPVVIAKIMSEFSKKNKGFNLDKGYLEGRVLSAERVKELADLPSREQLLAMIVGTMNAPISGFVGVLSSVLRSVLYAVNAIKEKKEQAA